MTIQLSASALCEVVNMTFAINNKGYEAAAGFNAAIYSTSVFCEPKSGFYELLGASSLIFIEI